MLLSTSKVAALILCGGKGSRSLNPNFPKCLALIESKPILEWQIRQLYDAEINEIWLLLGHLSAEILAWLQASEFKNINVVHDSKKPGTLQAVIEASRLSAAKIFCVISGDVMVSTDFRSLLQRHLSNSKDVSVVVHPNLHPESSDIVFTGSDKGIYFYSKEREPEILIPNSCATGVFFTNKDALRNIQALSGNIEQSLFEWANKSKEIGVISSPEYFSDTGTELRLAKVRKEVQSGKASKRADWSKNCILVDLDSTLCLDSIVRKKLCKPMIYPDVIPWLAKLNRTGISVFVISNQPALAKGQLSESELNDYLAQIELDLAKQGVLIDGIFYCPHHPEVGFAGEIVELKIDCECRKPKVGLVKRLESTMGRSVAPRYMVGDTVTDLNFAMELGIPFIHINREGLCTIKSNHSCVQNLIEIEGIFP